MAIVVLFSTLSFTVESHYCGNNLIDTAIFTKVKGCGGDVKIEASLMKSCCKNEVAVVKGQDKLKLNIFDDLDANQQQVLLSFFYTYDPLFTSLPKQFIPHKDYAPPKLIYDLQVLEESFLI